MSTTRSKSFLAAEAIAAYVEAEEWQIRETRSALHEVDGGDAIAHEQGCALAAVVGKTRRAQSARMKIVWSRRAISHLVRIRDYIAEGNPDARTAPDVWSCPPRLTPVEKRCAGRA